MISRNEFESILRAGTVEFQFEKADGSIREAKGTLKRELMPPQPEETAEQIEKRKNFTAANPDVITYWDIGSAGFRRVKLPTLTSMPRLVEVE